MGFNPNGGPSHVLPEERLNIFALVIYIPGQLGKFLDDLRRELVPSYDPHAHVSVLPPRPLAVDWQTASEQVRAQAEAWAPFEIELTGLEVFPVTEVLYLQVAGGGEELRRMHKAMNSGMLGFEEPFPYHPHITLAQEVPHDAVAGLMELTERRWREYRGPRSFRAERAVFVQNTLDNRWIDLAEYQLGAVAVP
jgi:2'-5' RNA ligase